MRKAIIYTVIFGFICIGLGLVAGVLVERAYTGRHFFRFMSGNFSQEKSQDWQKKKTEFLTQKISRNLDLTKEQKEQLKAILTQAGQEISRTRESLRESFAKTRENTLKQISAILTPEQQQKLEKIMSQYQKRDRRHSFR